jgi:hypothetical protein
MRLPPTYSVYLITPKGTETIVDATKSVWRARNIAQRLKVRLGRKVEVTRDNKTLPGGQHALDTICYQLWLEEHQPEA